MKWFACSFYRVFYLFISFCRFQAISYVFFWVLGKTFPGICHNYCPCNREHRPREGYESHLFEVSQKIDIYKLPRMACSIAWLWESYTFVSRKVRAILTHFILTSNSLTCGYATCSCFKTWKQLPPIPIIE